MEVLVNSKWLIIVVSCMLLLIFCVYSFVLICSITLQSTSCCICYGFSPTFFNTKLPLELIDFQIDIQLIVLGLLFSASTSFCISNSSSMLATPSSCFSPAIYCLCELHPECLKSLQSLALLKVEERLPLPEDFFAPEEFAFSLKYYQPFIVTRCHCFY